MLKIAQIGPLGRQIPPIKYGGTERVVSCLTEQLVKEGHDVTLFASGTTQTTAKLIATYPRPLSVDNIPWTDIMYPLLHITEAFDRANDFDIIHMHLNMPYDYLALPIATHHRKKTVFTLHFPYPSASDQEDSNRVFQKYKQLNYVSLSNAQRQGGENLNWVQTVYNGIDLNLYDFNPTPQDYFIWIGRFDETKGAYEAAIAAQKAGVKLILAGKTEDYDDNYFKRISSLFKDEHITYVGEINDIQKNDYFGGAIAFLNPIKWNEPFGLVMAESMACGTPVISFPNGSAPEIITDGETGFLVKNVDELVKRIHDVRNLKRELCRQRTEKLFSVEAMAEGYMNVYKQLLRK